MHTIHKQYGNKIRVRACGLYFKDGKILLAEHKGLGKADKLLIPPGGGVKFAETTEECLKREFREETGLEIKVEKFLFIHEFIDDPLHAIEVFFQVSKIGGRLRTGRDPEMTNEEQIIEKVDFYSKEDLAARSREELHAMLVYCIDPEDILQLSGYFNFDNNYIK